jgi:TM2 domain
MRRVITVNLGGNAFQLDEDAYERLRAYMSLTESRHGANPNRAEIGTDVERAVAEHIAANRTETGTVVVSDAEIEQALMKVGPIDRVQRAAAAESVAPPAGATYVRSAWDRDAESEYIRLPVFVLCLLFGWLGIHRFFVGKIGTGVLMLLTIGGLGIWMTIDLILIILGQFRDREGRKIQRWT